MAKITFKKGDKKKTVTADEGKTLLEIAQENNLEQDGIEIDHACGGNGYCTTCMCEVTENPDNLEEITDQEMAMGVENPETRLTCMAKVKGDCEVELPEY